MNVFTLRHPCFHRHTLLVVVAAAMIAFALPHVAHAADADSEQPVECMLPGQIHSVGGHATMGPRQPVRTTPVDCRARGGEYTMDEHASQPTPVAQAPIVIADDNKLVRCLLPKQERQLGEKANYTIAERTIRITRYNCRQRGGSVIGAPHAHHASPKK